MDSTTIGKDNRELRALSQDRRTVQVYKGRTCGEEGTERKSGRFQRSESEEQQSFLMKSNASTKGKIFPLNRRPRLLLCSLSTRIALHFSPNAWDLPPESSLLSIDNGISP